MLRRFCQYEHSLSVALGTGFLLLTVVSYFTKHGDDWWSNFWMSTGAGFGGGLVIVVFARPFYEKDSDPTRPAPTIDCPD